MVYLELWPSERKLSLTLLNSLSKFKVDSASMGCQARQDSGFELPSTLIIICSGFIDLIDLKSSSETQGFNGEGDGKETGSEKNEEKEGAGGREGKGEGKPWEASLHRVFLHQLLF